MARKAAGYLLSGGGAAVIAISLFRLCAPVMGVTAGATLSFLVAAVANFLVSSRYLFGAGGGARKAVLFLVFAGVGLVINVTATTHITPASDLPLILCKPGRVGIAFLSISPVNYLLVSVLNSIV